MATSKNKLLIFLIIIVVVLIIIAVVGKQQGWIGKGDKVKVATEKTSKRTIIETVSASGKIYPVTEIKITPDVSGEIIELSVKEGDSVTVGNLLVKIKPDIYLAMVDRAAAAVNASRANLANAKSRLSQMRAQLEKAELTDKRNNQLHEQKVISDADYESSQSAFKMAVAEVESAEHAVAASEFDIKSAEASLKESNDNLKKTTIYAPASGTISKLGVEKGERVLGTVQMTGTEMMRIANLNEMEARVDVSENDVVRVGNGDTAEIEVDAYLDRKFIGVVSEIANSSSSQGQITTEQVTNFTVKIRLLRSSYQDLLNNEKGHEFPFRPGMSCSVNIRTKTASDILTVPIQSVTTKEEEKKDSTDKQFTRKKEIKEIVFLYNNGKAIKKDVKTGIQDDTYIEIKSGLNENDEVIAAPYSAISRTLKDSMDVEKVDKDKLFQQEKK